MANLLSGLRALEVQPDAAWVETALGAVAQDRQRVPGDQLAQLVFEVGPGRGACMAFIPQYGSCLWGELG